MANAEEVLRMVHDRVSSGIDEMLRDDLPKEFSEVAAKLYKEQYTYKVNPYGEAWEPRPGDDKRLISRHYGKVMSVDFYTFSLRVAAPNARRSCVPFEPRGLGRWKAHFDDTLHRSLPTALARLK